LADPALQNIRRALNVCAVLLNSARSQRNPGLARTAVRRARVAYDDAVERAAELPSEQSNALSRELDELGASLAQLERALEDAQH